MPKTVLKLSAASLIAAMTAACAASTVKIEGCTVFAPIYGSKKDTQPTRDQVDAHNAKGVGACGWKP